MDTFILYAQEEVYCPAFLSPCFLTVAATEETITLLIAILFLTASEAWATNYVTMLLKCFIAGLVKLRLPQLLNSEAMKLTQY